MGAPGSNLGLRMKSPVVKRSIVIAGHKTSVSLEDAFWDALKEIAAAIRRLRDDPDLRQRMVRNGFTRAQEVQPARLAEQWQCLFTEVGWELGIPGFTAAEGAAAPQPSHS